MDFCYWLWGKFWCWRLPGEYNNPEEALLVENEKGDFLIAVGVWCSSAAAWKLRRTPHSTFKRLFPQGCSFIIGEQSFRYLDGVMRTGTSSYTVNDTIVFTHYRALL